MMRALASLLVAALAAFAAPASAQEQQFADLGTCGEISDCRIGYRTVGMLNEARDNAVLVPAWYGGTTEQMDFLAAAPFLDPETYFIILVDPIGNGVSISPSNSPSQPLGEFPALSIGDMVESEYRLVTEHLGLTRLHAVTGISMGGMQTFEWAARYPGFAEKFVPIIGSPRLPTYDIVFWDTGNAMRKWERECRCVEAREIAAGFNLVTRPIGLANTLAARSEAFDYIETSAQQDSFDEGTSWNMQRQSEAMIDHDIARHFGGDMALAARELGRQLEMMVVVSREDRVVSPDPAMDFARLAGFPLLVTDEGCGHGDFRCNPDVWTAAAGAFLASED
ncbi:alpha/beta hydrolase [Aurantiacibacter poecillastricola]|uniref:alpha/beta hydrolase n=1 Tax=Aurantiacibacter poecillastricola TaxID=3064385 RepID=UPI00273D13A9|nr:alpha/beta hydrolase [Aurantiacibacter sp. 219JJ12-13]MDP5260772.1 alpha/beta hydrolase [Aurantiacibacter sp. 219JJ12-13]